MNDTSWNLHKEYDLVASAVTCWFAGWLNPFRHVDSLDY